MLSTASRIVLGVVMVGSMMAGVVVVGTDRYSDTEATLAKACAGVPTHSRLDYTVFSLRAQSNGGELAVCEPASKLDEDAASSARTARLDRRLLRKGW